MKTLKKVILFLFCCVLLVSGGTALAYAATAFPSETNAFVSNYYVEPINQDKPFFEKVLPEIAKNIKENNKHSITPYYDAFPKANNPENFQGLGSTTYANINGKKVTVEAFYRIPNEALCDPNTGMGLLIYQCIQYKLKHPAEDVKITFTSYRTSAATAVCVLPESKYYGYSRALYGTNYDEHGFVRVSYMLTEAARMGIKVTMVNQLPSYGKSQYDPVQGKTRYRSHINYETYYAQALKSACYNKYAPGKKVSDFMDFTRVGWNVENKTSDMQHVKSATVSHYLATDGTEHQKAVYFSSSNFDEIDYRGANGHNGSQSGVIISDHDELYRVTYNYTRLMYKYRGKEDMFKLRKYMNEANEKQAELLRSGKGNLIPKDEQIVYVGTKNDPVFELYFTPFGGGIDAWDPVNNPISKYVDKLPKSTGYVEFVWNAAGYGRCNLGNTMSDILQNVYINNRNVNNKIAIRATDFDSGNISNLKAGTDIGYVSIKKGSGIHAKDMIMSYVENGVRHNVSLITSCNFYTVAYNYRTNSMLVINETAKTGGNFYEIFGAKYSYGMIKKTLMVNSPNLTLSTGDSFTPDVDYSGNGKLTWSTSDKSIATVENGKIKAHKTGSVTLTVTDGTVKDTIKLKVVTCKKCTAFKEGITCNTEEQYILNKKLSSMPLTFEAVFSVNQSDLRGTTTLLGNDDMYDPAIMFTLNKNGQPRVALRATAGTSTQKTYTFNKINVATGEKVHLAFTIDLTNKKIHCYVNGELAQTISISISTPYVGKYNMIVGGDHRNGNNTYFPGVLESLAVWSDIRTAAEISSDNKNGITASDKNLLAAYNFKRCDECMKKDLSSNKNDLYHGILWQSKEDVEPVGDYDYAFVAVGDTQTMCEKDPGAMEAIYDWIVKNQKSQKIEFVMGLGDITDDSTDVEWSRANSYISKLNGVVPYSLSRGNHDDWDDFNRNLHNGYYEKTVNGMMNSGNINLSDPTNQPGVTKKVAADGTVTYITNEEDVPEGGTVKGDLTNSYRYLDIHGTKYLIMTLDFAPSSATLKWVDKVVSSHPDHRVIITTHAYMYRDGTTMDTKDLYPATHYKGYTDAQNGNMMWEKCISKHKNIVLVISGHDPWQHIAYRQDKGVNGNVVTQMLVDAQYVDLYGSTGMIAMLYFSDNGEKLTVRFYSVVKDCYGSPESQFTINLKEHQHNYKTETVKATLTTDGKVTTDCFVCDEVTTKTIYSPSTFTLSKTEYVYDGKEKTPSVTVKDKKGNTLKKGTDYTVEYEAGHKNPGRYTVTIKFKGNYEGTKKLAFNIKPAVTSKVTAAQTTSSITLKWNKVTGATGYRVYTYNTKTKKYEQLKDITDTSFKISKLSSATEYRYKVKAYTKDGETTIWGDSSAEFKTATKPTVTKKITASQTTSTITLKWSKVTGAKGYRVYKYNTKTKKYEKLKDITETSLKISKLKAGTEYRYKVKAYTKFSETTVWGDSSAEFKTATKPAAPTLKATSTSKGKVSLSWSNVSGESGYQVYYSTKEKGEYKKLDSYKANTLKASRSKLASKKTYYFKARAYKKTTSGTIYSAWSSVKKVTIK